MLQVVNDLKTGMQVDLGIWGKAMFCHERHDLQISSEIAGAVAGMQDECPCP